MVFKKIEIITVILCLPVIAVGALNIISRHNSFRLNPIDIQENIFFIGDMEGFLTETINCQGLNNTVSKISSVLNYYKRYLLFDVGGFSSANTKNYKILLDYYRQVGISGLNLTPFDINNLYRDKYAQHNKLFISSNIETELIENKCYEKSLLNQSDKNARLIIIGLSDNKRVYSQIAKKYKYNDSSESLIRDLSKYESKNDIIILMVHDSLFNLSNILKKIKSNKIKYIVGCFGEFEYEGKLENIPTIYISSKGRGIGHIKIVIQENTIDSFFDVIKLNNNYPDDLKTKRYLDLILNTYDKRIEK